MDDFEKEYPDFDWKNTPAYKHPGGKNCPCPKHEYIREQINFAKQVNEAGSDAARVTLKFCPEHYQVYIKEVIPAMPLKYKILTKIALKNWSNTDRTSDTHAIRFVFLLQVWFRWTWKKKRTSTYALIYWTNSNFWSMWRIMMTFLSTYWTHLSIKKYALANV